MLSFKSFRNLLCIKIHSDIENLPSTFEFILFFYYKFLKKTFCFRFPHAFVYFGLVWLLPFVAAWIFTVLASIQSKKRLKSAKENLQNRSYEIVRKIDKDVNKTVIIVLSIFTVTVLPVIISGIIRFVIVASSTQLCNNRASTAAFFFCTYIHISGRFLNVIIYNFFNKEFKMAFHKLVSELKIIKN